MKLGILVSLIIVLALGGLGYVIYRGFPDAPTSATSEEKLASVAPPASLEPLFTPTNPDADATGHYDKAFKLYAQHDRAFADGEPGSATMQRLATNLKDAADAGQIEPGWLDEQLPLVLNPDAEFGAALELISMAGLLHAQSLYEKGQHDQAAEMAKAVWALGYRAFTANQRLYARNQGLTIMREALGALRVIGDETQLDTEAINAWLTWTDQIGQRYDGKMRIVLSTKPQMGDLFNIVRNDQDPAFRIAAVLRLGPAKFHAGGRGNKRVLLSLIEQCKTDDNPMVAEAAKVADETTVQDVRRM